MTHLLPRVSYCFMFLMKWIFFVCRGRGEPPERFRDLQKDGEAKGHDRRHSQLSKSEIWMQKDIKLTHNHTDTQSQA